MEIKMEINLPPEYERQMTMFSNDFPGERMFYIYGRGMRLDLRIYDSGRVHIYRQADVPEGMKLDRKGYIKFPDYDTARAWVENMCALNLWSEK